MSLKAPRPGLPALNTLRAFEAAARHESFARAAEELNVTPGAVAQQVKALEAWLGTPLFRRLSQGLRLTDGARAALPALVEAFDALGAAVRELKDSVGPDELRVAALPALAQLWLSPRRAALAALCPGGRVSISALEAPPDFARELYDLAIFYTEGSLPGVEVIPLAEDLIFPVCSPTLLEGERPLRRPADLAGQVLLHDAAWRNDWQLWLDRADAAAVDGETGPDFSLYSLALEAAVDGAGVLIGHEALVAPAIARGDLVAPFPSKVPTGKRLSLILLETSRRQDWRADVSAWFRAQAAASVA
jgi:LysR family glycine cleavage system transcriptional activator